MKLFSSTRCKKCQNCSAFRRSVFVDSSEEVLQTNFLYKTMNYYSKGQVLFEIDAPFYGVFCVEEGQVELHGYGPNGEKTSKIVGPGSLIGMTEEGVDFYDHSAIALVDSSACFIEKKYFYGIKK